jgi:hypothetical protein
MKIVNFIYSRNKLDFKKYTKDINYNDVISYHDIITKLIKNDKNNEKPSENVVNTYMIRKIIRSVSVEADSIILYALSDINSDTINSICELMESHSESDITFNFTIITHKKFNISDEEINTLRSIDYIKNIEIAEQDD